MKKALISLLLAVLMLLGTVACNTSNNQAESTAADGTGTNISDPETDDVPDSVRFDGKYLTFTTVSWYNYEMYVEEPEDGDITSEAVYRRNRTVEERLGITIDSIPINNVTHAEQPNYVRTSILAETHDFDVVASFMYTTGGLILENLFHNWGNGDIPYVNLDKPYWSKTINDSFTVGDRLYSAVSDTCITAMQTAYGYLFNKEIVEDRHLENFYQVVDEGRWTVDYLYNLTKNMYSDLNSDMSRDTGDFYGLLSDLNTSVTAYLPAFEQTIFKSTGDDIVCTLDDSKTINCFEKVRKLLRENDGCFWYWHGNNGFTYEDKHPIFKSGNVLFIPIRLSALYDQYRDADFDYGVLPYPKYDEVQKNYHNSCLNNFSVLCIPSNITGTDLEKIGAAMEIMASESRKRIIPAFYETALQDKYTTDEDSKRMLDIIMETRVFDIAHLYSQATSGAYSFFEEIMRSGEMFTTAYAVRRKMFDNAAHNLYESILKVGTLDE